MSLLKISQVSTCNTKHNALLFPICLATAYTIAAAKLLKIIGKTATCDNFQRKSHVKIDFKHIFLYFGHKIAICCDIMIQNGNKLEMQK